MRRTLGLLLLTLCLGACSPGRPEDSTRTVALLRLSDIDLETMSSFKQEMAKLGHHEGRQVRYLEAPAAVTPDRLDALAAGLLAQKPDVVVVSSTQGALAVKRRLNDACCAVVFAPVNNPVASGVVPDLRQPGGQITGVTIPQVDGLRLAWLQQIAPHVRKVYMPYTATDPSASASAALVTDAARSLGIELAPYRVRADEDSEGALAAFPPDAQALLILPDSHVQALFEPLLQAANRRHVPVIAPGALLVHRGATFSYGASKQEIGKRAARLADEILRGISPGDLPVQIADSQLAINLAAAQAIGMTVPRNVVRSADIVLRAPVPATPPQSR